MTEPFRSFTLFSNLIPELREQIWISTFKPHLCRISQYTAADKQLHRSRRDDLDPVALRVCRESRHIALRTYKRLDTVYFNPCTDIIFLQFNPRVQIQATDITWLPKGIRYLAVDHLWMDEIVLKKDFKSLEFLFALQLRSLIVVHEYIYYKKTGDTLWLGAPNESAVETEDFEFYWAHNSEFFDEAKARFLKLKETEEGRARFLKLSTPVLEMATLRDDPDMMVEYSPLQGPANKPPPNED